MIKPKSLVDVYVASRICIQSEKGSFVGHYSDLKNKYRMDEESLYIALKKLFEAGNITIKLKLKP